MREALGWLLDQPWLPMLIVWPAVAQGLWFGIVLPMQRRRTWPSATMTVIGHKRVGQTMSGSQAAGTGIYQVLGRLHRPGHPELECQSVDRVKLDGSPQVGTTMACLYDPEHPHLVQVSPREAPVLLSVKGVVVVLVCLGALYLSARPLMRALGWL